MANPWSSTVTVSVRGTRDGNGTSSDRTPTACWPASSATVTGTVISAADATVHMLENPYLPPFLEGQAVPITVVLLLILGGVFLLGFSEAVAVAIPLVAIFLLLNAVIIGVGLYDAITQPGALSAWTDALTSFGTGFGDIAGPALLL